jgi:hypothetical protein
MTRSSGATTEVIYWLAGTVWMDDSEALNQTHGTFWALFKSAC